MDDSQKSFRKARSAAQLGYLLIGISVLYHIYEWFTPSVIKLDFLDIFEVMLRFVTNAFWIIGVVALIYAIVKFGRLRRSNFITKTPVLPKVILVLSIIFMIVVIASIAMWNLR